MELFFITGMFGGIIGYFIAELFNNIYKSYKTSKNKEKHKGGEYES